MGLRSGSRKQTPVASEQALVAQANTILVYQFGISPDNADAKLRAVASLTYRSVAQVARKIVESNGL
jgi:AmiR/NasT family two-component response regulator